MQKKKKTYAKTEKCEKIQWHMKFICPFSLYSLRHALNVTYSGKFIEDCNQSK